MKYVEVKQEIKRIAPDDPYYTKPCAWLLRAYAKDGTTEDHEYLCTEEQIQLMVLDYYTIEADRGGWAGADYFRGIDED